MNQLEYESQPVEVAVPDVGEVGAESASINATPDKKKKSSPLSFSKGTLYSQEMEPMPEPVISAANDHEQCFEGGSPDVKLLAKATIHHEFETKLKS